MRILLLSPNYDAHIVHPPIGLGCLAAWLERHGHEAFIFDGTLHKAEETDFLDKIAEVQPDLVGISLMTRAHNRVKKLIAAFRKRFGTEPLVAVGGPQITARPLEACRSLQPDFAVVGEGELTLGELVEHLAKGQHEFDDIDGLVYKSPDGYVFTRPRELIANLDILPYPAWHLMPPKDYRVEPILAPAKGQPIGQVMSGRGCPHNCSFCASNATWRRKLRLRSVDHLLGEIRMLVEDYGVKEIHFCDDSFTSDMKRAERICDAIIDSGMRFHWQCPNGIRGDRFSDTMLRKMKDSGCYAVGLGVESGNADILKRVDKKLKLEHVQTMLGKLRQVGIMSYGFFILGLPGDSRESIEDTVRFALDNPFDRAWFNIFTPYPGASAFEEWLGTRDYEQIDWDEHDCSTAVAAELTQGLTGEELEQLQKRAALLFYLRPKTLFSVVSRWGLPEIKSLFMTRFFRHFVKILD